MNTELAEELRQRDRATVEAIRELAGAVARVRTGISEIQRGFQQRGPEQAGQSGSAALGDVADVVGELRTATLALTTAVTKLDDIAAGLAAISPIGMSATGARQSASRFALAAVDRAAGTVARHGDRLRAASGRLPLIRGLDRR